MNIFKPRLIILLFAICFSSCTNNGKNTEIIDQDCIRLNMSIAELKEGGKVLITAEFSGETVKNKSFVWSSDAPDTVSIEADGGSASVLALKEGKALVKIESADKSVYAGCLITVTKDGGKYKRAGEVNSVKVLGIGNSFTADIFGYYLYELAKAAEKEVIIGCLAAGGATLEEHLQNAESAGKAYEYVKINKDGEVSRVYGVSMEEGISDEEWDYICFQQQSWLSGQFDSYSPYIPKLLNYAKSKSRNSSAVYCILQTWAFAHDYTYDDFDYYGNSQIAMYAALVDAAGKAAKLAETDMTVIPAGTAVQNGRTSSIGDNFCADGYHLNDIGRFTAACALYESFFNACAEESGYKPESISGYHSAIAKRAALYAAMNPGSVIEMVEFQKH